VILLFYPANVALDNFKVVTDWGDDDLNFNPGNEFAYEPVDTSRLGEIRDRNTKGQLE
jgi:hypothetical protein